MANIAIMRMPDDSPSANDSTGNSPSEEQINARHPKNVSVFPTHISRNVLLRRSGKVKPVKIHHFVPRRHKVPHKRRFTIVTAIDFRECPQLRV